MKNFAYRNAAVLLSAILTIQSIASAHAFLDHADPKVGSEIVSAPAEVKIWFTQAIEPAFSSIQIYDAAGKEIDKKDSHVDASDKKLLIVSLPATSSGKYKVVWHVVSVDTHRTQGDFKFTVK